jgi:hypothetical protein
MNHEIQAARSVLAHVARADFKIRSEERLALDALGEWDGGVSATEILRDHTDLDSLLLAVVSPELRRRTLVAAVAVANVDGHCPPEELAVLEQIRDAFGAREQIDLLADSAAWKRRTAHVRAALEGATVTYLHDVHAEAQRGGLSMERHERLAAELSKAKKEIQGAFRNAVEEAEST